MNERIFELAEQANAFARETVEYNRSDDFSEFTDRLYTVSREKFAELLIREFLDVISDESEKVSDEWRCKDGKHIWWKIKEHFGVLE